MSDELKPIEKPMTLERWVGEQTKHHRGLLLYAMQAPHLRSKRRVAVALSAKKGTQASDPAIRNWHRDRKWKERMAPYGDDVDQAALDIYRREYMADFGKIEMPHVVRNVVRELGEKILDPSSRESHEQRKRREAALPLASQEVEHATRTAIAEFSRDVREEAKRHITLVDTALKVIAEKLAGDEVRVTMRDIPVLLECRARLVEVFGDHQPGNHGPIVETSRVKHAKATGGDLVAAMHEDAVELVAILGALKVAGDVNRAALAEEQQQVKAEAEAAERA